jgi:hypothetical protein
VINTTSEVTIEFLGVTTVNLDLNVIEINAWIAP